MLPLTVTEVRSSCGCTTALVEGEEGLPRLPLVLPPGRQFRVRVAVDPTHLIPGPMDKSVWVFAAGHDAPVATLRITGDVLPVASFSPPDLDFGRTASGQARSLALTVTLDPRQLPGGVVPRLVSPDPDVQVAPDGGPDDKRVYRVTLSPQAALGPLDGRLSLVYAASGSTTGNLSGGSVPLSGEVVGEVASAPQAVAFGAVPAGKAANQQVILTGTGLGTLRVSCVSTYLSARLRVTDRSDASARAFGTAPDGTAASPVPAAPGATSQVAVLNVTLSPGTPPGPLESRVLVTTRSGQRLSLPVFALVTAGGR